MSSSKEFGQDYLARVRYRNDLPPPPGAPKLLEIPHDGLARFLRPGYASRLVREQPLNIDVDAEGGMPMDMVGVPGYFFGDESAIMAPDHPPLVDPKDALLLRPLASLGKPATTATNVSFLRRTEYIGTQHGGKSDHAAIRGSAKKPRADLPPKHPELNKEDPIYIKKFITKGFDIANPSSRHVGPDTPTSITGLKPTPAELDAWKNPVHPTNPSLKPLDYYPLVPDLDAFTDDGGFLVYQFKKAPTATSDHKHDDRITMGLFRPPPFADEDRERFMELKRKHDLDPERNPDPGEPLYDYDFYIPTDATDVPPLCQKFSNQDPNRDDPALYTARTDEGTPAFRYDYVRTYETAAQVPLVKNQYLHVALSLVDPDNDRNSSGRLKQKAAYYYPIIQNIRLQPQRQIAFSQASRPEDWEKADQIFVMIEDPDDDEISTRMQHRLPLDVKLAKERGWTGEEAARQEKTADEDVDMDRGQGGSTTQRNGEEVMETVEDGDRDASGEDDVDIGMGLSP